jgi:WhiB family redox-sensing transcriptional regulator
MRTDSLNELIFTLPASPDLRRGACLVVDPDLFFNPNTEHAAKQVCLRCPVRGACLDYALGCGEKHGVWGGTTEAERLELLRQRPPVRRRHPAECGSRSRYLTGCRCEECREANRQYNVRRRVNGYRPPVKDLVEA